jgi:hypothetical protein
MVFPDLPKVEMGGAFGCNGGMCRDEVHVFGYTVDDVHNCVIAMGLGQFDYEVNTNHVLWFHRCLQGMELPEEALVLQLHLVT